jgi:hypothetical protein
VGCDGYPLVPGAGLRGAVADAVAVREWLLDPAGGRMAADAVTLLVSLSACGAQPGAEVVVHGPAGMVELAEAALPCRHQQQGDADGRAELRRGAEETADQAVVASFASAVPQDVEAADAMPSPSLDRASPVRNSGRERWDTPTAWAVMASAMAGVPLRTRRIPRILPRPAQRQGWVWGVPGPCWLI